MAQMSADKEVVERPQIFTTPCVFDEARFTRLPRVIAPSTILSGASMRPFCVAPSYAWFIAASIVWGVASAIGGAAASVYAADSAPPGHNAATPQRSASFAIPAMSDTFWAHWRARSSPIYSGRRYRW